MKLHKLQRFLCGVAGISLISTVALLLAAATSGSIAQKDKFADLAASTGFLYATTFVASMKLEDYLEDK